MLDHVQVADYFVSGVQRGLLITAIALMFGLGLKLVFKALQGFNK